METVKVNIDYPTEPLNRTTSFFRIFTLIPIAIVLSTVSGGASMMGGGETKTVVAAAGGTLVAGPLLMILFRQKYPKWWFDWNLELTRFSTRVGTYVLLMTDKYPSTDEVQNVHIEIQYPDAKQLNRWLVLVKWFLAIPHYIALFFLTIGVFFTTLFSWFAILFTGKYPEGFFRYNEGVIRWSTRVTAYAFILATDEYPPFSLK